MTRPQSRLTRRDLPLLAGIAGAILLLAHAGLTGRSFLPSYLVAWLFLLGLSLGSLALLALHQLTGGAWGEAIEGMLQAMLGNLPWIGLLGLPLAGGLDQFLAGSGDDPYLRPPFYLLRAALFFLAWMLAARQLRRHPGAGTAAAVLLGYAVTMTLAATDWVMSLTPHWHSTAAGLLACSAQVLAALAGAVLGTVWRERGTWVRFGRAWHDLGKLLFVLCLLWAYLAFMQLLIVWFEDLPGETAWYLPRIDGAWRGLAGVVLLLQFVLPLGVLLSRRASASPRVLAAVSVLVLAGTLASTAWDLLPSLRPGGARLQASDVFALLALGGPWIALLQRALRRAPPGNAPPAGGAVAPGAGPAQVHPG